MMKKTKFVPGMEYAIVNSLEELQKFFQKSSGEYELFLCSEEDWDESRSLREITEMVKTWYTKVRRADFAYEGEEPGTIIRVFGNSAYSHKPNDIRGGVEVNEGDVFFYEKDVGVAIFKKEIPNVIASRYHVFRLVK